MQNTYADDFFEVEVNETDLFEGESIDEIEIM